MGEYGGRRRYRGPGRSRPEDGGKAAGTGWESSFFSLLSLLHRGCRLQVEGLKFSEVRRDLELSKVCLFLCSWFLAECVQVFVPFLCELSNLKCYDVWCGGHQSTVL